MLVLLHAGEILLEKRPSTGIWGGLWSLPECPVDAAPEEAARRLGYEADHLGDLPELGHTFSHFRLRILPRHLALTRREPNASEPGRLWLSLADADQAALPTPIRKILAALTDG